MRIGMECSFGRLTTMVSVCGDAVVLALLKY